MSRASPEFSPKVSPDLAAAIDFVAASAFFEAARDGEAALELAGIGGELRALARPPGAESTRTPAGDGRILPRAAEIERRIGRVRRNQCEIAGLADKIAASARRWTAAFRYPGQLARVVVYSRERARRLCLLVTGIEAQQARLAGALAADRERVDAVERALAASRKGHAAGVAPGLIRPDPQAAGPR